MESGKMLVSLEKRKSLKSEFMRDTSEFFDLRMEMYLIDIVKTYAVLEAYAYIILFYNFLILFIVCIGAELMKSCLASRARNLEWFCFYFSTAAILENFCYIQCKSQVTVSLILTETDF